MTVVNAVASDMEDSLHAIGMDDGVFIGPERPVSQGSYPAILIGLGNTTYSKEGMAGYGLADEDTGEMMFWSEGTIEMTVVGRSIEELWSLRDLLTQSYLSHMLRPGSYWRTSEEALQGVALRFDPGQINWSRPQYQSPPWEQNPQRQLAYSSASIPFDGEHRHYFKMLNVSRIDIQAVPYIPDQDNAGTFVQAKQ